MDHCFLCYLTAILAEAKARSKRTAKPKPPVFAYDNINVIPSTRQGSLTTMSMLFRALDRGNDMHVDYVSLRVLAKLELALMKVCH